MSSAVSPITRHTVGRTFFGALAVLGAGAVAQLGVIGWFYVARFHAKGGNETAYNPAMSRADGAGKPAFSDDPFADPAVAGMAVAGTPAPAPITPPPKPTPVSQTTLAPATLPTAQDRFNELVEQAKALRKRGDTYAAVTKLREAQATDPHSAEAPAELALTYEMMGFPEKATECWSRVYEMGEAGGIYYNMSVAKRQLSELKTQAQVTNSIPSAPATGGAADVTVSQHGGPNSKLGLGSVTRKDESDPTADRKFTLTLPIRAKPRARIDVRDVIVQVLFYDAVNGKVLDRTNAQVSYKWVSPPPDWSDSDIEPLEVTYVQPARHVSDEERKYFGYIATVYYKNALQDFSADPPKLAEKLPPKPVLTADPE